MLRSDIGLYPVELPNGYTIVDLQGRYQHMSTATIDSNGKLSTHFCGMKDKPNHKHVKSGEQK